LIASARRRLVPRVVSTPAGVDVLAHARITLLVAGAVLIANHLVLAAGHHVFAATCIDAVVLVLLLNAAALYESRSDGPVLLVLRLNAAAFHESRSDGRDVIVAGALGALALAAAVPVAAAALPLSHVSEATGTITIGLPVAAAAVYFASRQKIRLRPLFTPAGAALNVATVAAAVAFGFCAYLLKAPVMDTHRPKTAALGVAALIVAAVAEELLFRGVVQTSLTRALGTQGLAFAILLSAGLLTSVSWWMIAALAAITSFALVVAATGALGPAITGHLAFTLGAVLVWPSVLDHRHLALGIAVPLCAVLCAGLVVVVGAFARNVERRNV
jgi:membrane protease YdiL (CAAX protease family)